MRKMDYLDTSKFAYFTMGNGKRGIKGRVSFY